MSDYDYTDAVDDHAEPDSYPELDDDPTLTPEGDVTNLDVDDGLPFQQPEVSELPSELRFGAQIGPYGETEDSWAEKYNYSTTTDSYIGAQSGREIDPWTGTEKK